MDTTYTPWSSVAHVPQRSSLFGTPPPAAGPSIPRTFASPHKGYLAFAPPSTPSAKPTPSLLAPPSAPESEPENYAHVRERRSRERAARAAQDEAARAARLALEAAIARENEREWVRSGGVLRDAQGRRDYARTDALRAEIRREEEERALVRRWERYEARWREAVVAGEGAVTFVDVPWPVPAAHGEEGEGVSRALVQEQLADPKFMRDFLLSPLNVRESLLPGRRTTKRDRLRREMLHWHPDKLSGLVGRVVEEDEADVREGIAAVFMQLKSLQDEEKDNSN
jgi:hypothetical protein